MTQSIYNEGRVVGLSAYEIYVRNVLAKDANAVPASEADWLAANIASGSSLIVKIPAGINTTNNGYIDIPVPEGSQLCAANTIIANWFDGSGFTTATGATSEIDYIDSYGRLISEIPSGDITNISSQIVASSYLDIWNTLEEVYAVPGSAEQLAALQEYFKVDAQIGSMLSYLNIVDGVILQPGTYTHSAVVSDPGYDYSPDLTSSPIIRLHVADSQRWISPYDVWILFTGFTLKSVVNTSTSATHTPEPYNGDFLGPAAFPWANKIIFTVPNKWENIYNFNSLKWSIDNSTTEINRDNVKLSMSSIPSRPVNDPAVVIEFSESIVPGTLSITISDGTTSKVYTDNSMGKILLDDVLIEGASINYRSGKLDNLPIDQGTDLALLKKNSQATYRAKIPLIFSPNDKSIVSTTTAKSVYYTKNAPKGTTVDVHPYRKATSTSGIVIHNKKDGGDDTNYDYPAAGYWYDSHDLGNRLYPIDVVTPGTVKVFSKSEENVLDRAEEIQKIYPGNKVWSIDDSTHQLYQVGTEYNEEGSVSVWEPIVEAGYASTENDVSHVSAGTVTLPIQKVPNEYFATIDITSLFNTGSITPKTFYTVSEHSGKMSYFNLAPILSADQAEEMGPDQAEEMAADDPTTGEYTSKSTDCAGGYKVFLKIPTKSAHDQVLSHELPKSYEDLLTTAKLEICGYLRDGLTLPHTDNSVTGKGVSTLGVGCIWRNYVNMREWNLPVSQPVGGGAYSTQLSMYPITAGSIAMEYTNISSTSVGINTIRRTNRIIHTEDKIFDRVDYALFITHIEETFTQVRINKLTNTEEDVVITLNNDDSLELAAMPRIDSMKLQVISASGESKEYYVDNFGNVRDSATHQIATVVTEEGSANMWEYSVVNNSFKFNAAVTPMKIIVTYDVSPNADYIVARTGSQNVLECTYQIGYVSFDTLSDKLAVSDSTRVNVQYGARYRDISEEYTDNYKGIHPMIEPNDLSAHSISQHSSERIDVGGLALRLDNYSSMNIKFDNVPGAFNFDICASMLPTYVRLGKMQTIVTLSDASYPSSISEPIENSQPIRFHKYSGTYSHNLAHTPVLPGSLTITATVAGESVTFYDDGLGRVINTSAALQENWSVDYDTGVIRYPTNISAIQCSYLGPLENESDTDSPKYSGEYISLNLIGPQIYSHDTDMVLPAGVYKETIDNPSFKIVLTGKTTVLHRSPQLLMEDTRDTDMT